MAFDDSAKTDGYQEKLVSVARTAKVVKGGRVFGFAALVVVGDGKGKIGYGRGKAREVPIAIQKAMDQARKNMVYIPLSGKTIYHTITWTFGASKVFMKPASEGTGVIAGGSSRAVLEACGIKDILTKSLGSANHINVAKATMIALGKLRDPAEVVARRMSIVTEEKVEEAASDG